MIIGIPYTKQIRPMPMVGLHVIISVSALDINLWAGNSCLFSPCVSLSHLAEKPREDHVWSGIIVSGYFG